MKASKMIKKYTDEKKQTAPVLVRLDPLVYKAARGFLDEHHITWNDFMNDLIQDFIDSNDIKLEEK